MGMFSQFITGIRHTSYAEAIQWLMKESDLEKVVPVVQKFCSQLPDGELKELARGFLNNPNSKTIAVLSAKLKTTPSASNVFQGEWVPSRKFGFVSKTEDTLSSIPPAQANLSNRVTAFFHGTPQNASGYNILQAHNKATGYDIAISLATPTDGIKKRDAILNRLAISGFVTKAFIHPAFNFLGLQRVGQFLLGHSYRVAPLTSAEFAAERSLFSAVKSGAQARFVRASMAEKMGEEWSKHYPTQGMRFGAEQTVSGIGRVKPTDAIFYPEYNGGLKATACQSMEDLLGENGVTAYAKLMSTAERLNDAGVQGYKTAAIAFLRNNPWHKNQAHAAFATTEHAALAGYLDPRSVHAMTPGTDTLILYQGFRPSKGRPASVDLETLAGDPSTFTNNSQLVTGGLRYTGTRWIPHITANTGATGVGLHLSAVPRVGVTWFERMRGRIPFLQSTAWENNLNEPFVAHTNQAVTGFGMGNGVFPVHVPQHGPSSQTHFWLAGDDAPLPDPRWLGQRTYPGMPFEYPESGV